LSATGRAVVDALVGAAHGEREASDGAPLGRNVVWMLVDSGAPVRREFEGVMHYCNRAPTGFDRPWVNSARQKAHREAHSGSAKVTLETGQTWL